jgi:hypothetical protein
LRGVLLAEHEGQMREGFCLRHASPEGMALPMARMRNERENDERQERLEHTRNHVISGELVVRQMTASERRQWKERSDSFDFHATPQERAARRAALQKMSERAKRDWNW